MLDCSQMTRFADSTNRKGIYRSQVRLLIIYHQTYVHTDTCFSGHGDAAVKLQRDWLLDPQSLPFAQNIKTHALVSLVHKGLQYHQIEHSLDQVSHNAQSITTLSHIS